MRTLKASQKGRGWLGNRWKDFRRALTGRKRTMKKVNAHGTMKVANKATENRESANALEARPGYQKLLNKVVYKKGELKPVPRPSTQRSTMIELSDTGKLPEGAVANYLKERPLNQLGIEDFDVRTNKRDPFDRNRAKQPDSQLPNAGPIPYRPALRVVNGVDEKETQVQAQIRVLPVFYALWKELLSADDILTNDYATVIDSLREAGLPVHIKDISENELQEFLGTVRHLYDEGLKESQNETSIPAETLFHTSEAKLQKVLDRLEYAGPENQEKYIVDTLQRNVDGTYVPVRKIAVAGAVAISRYIAFLTSGLDYIRMMYEHDSQRCLVPIGRPGRDRRSAEIYEPLTTLNSNQCVKLLNGLDTFLQMKSLVTTTDFFYGNWIVLHKQYFPLRGETTEQIVAKAIPYASYIQDAFNNWGIDAMDQYLFQLFEIKYPQYSMKVSSYMTTPQRFLRLKATVERERADYPVGKGSFDFVNFMLVDEEILKDNPTFLAHVNPFEGQTAIQDLTTKAIESQKLYMVSPYISYFMKRKYLNEYYNAFKTPGVSKLDDPLTKVLQVYTTLGSEQEKITVDYLQYLYILDQFQERVLEPLNEGRASQLQFRERFEQIRSLSATHLTPAVLRLLTREKLEALTLLQSMVDSKAPNTTPEFLRSVLRKVAGDSSALFGNNSFQRGRVSLTQRAVNTRKQERNAVERQIQALQQEYEALSKGWNPFKAKTRKLRKNQIQRNIAALQTNYKVKQRLYEVASEQLQTTEGELLHTRPSVLMRKPRSKPVRTIYGLENRQDPFN